MSHQRYTLNAYIQKRVALKYWLALPNGYRKNSKQPWPLIIFLHGMDERGEDLRLVKKHGIPKIAEEWANFPFIALSPQCPEDMVWTDMLDDLHALVEIIIHEHRVDTARIYLTGISMGGYGVWHFAAAYPHLFAAIAPICGGTQPYVGFPERIRKLKDLPIWVFHGALDDAVPLYYSQELVDVLRRCRGNVRFTVYHDKGHDAWTETYNNPELYAWLLNHSNPQFHMTHTLLDETQLQISKKKN